MEEKVIKMVIYYILSIYDKKDINSCIEITKLLIGMVKNEETKADRLLNTFPPEHPVSKLYSEIKKLTNEELIEVLEKSKDKFINYLNIEVLFDKIENEEDVNILTKKILNQEGALTWKYVKKLDNINDIIEIESQYNIQIPTTLKNIIIQDNGGRPSKKIFTLKSGDEKVIKSLLSFNKEDRETVYSFKDLIKKDYLPFVTTEFGDVICLNIKDNSIELYEHETDKFEYICQNIDEFLKELR